MLPCEERLEKLISLRSQNICPLGRIRHRKAQKLKERIRLLVTNREFSSSVLEEIAHCIRRDIVETTSFNKQNAEYVQEVRKSLFLFQEYYAQIVWVPFIHTSNETISKLLGKYVELEYNVFYKNANTFKYEIQVEVRVMNTINNLLLKSKRTDDLDVFRTNLHKGICRILFHFVDRKYISDKEKFPSRIFRNSLASLGVLENVGCPNEVLNVNHPFWIKLNKFFKDGHYSSDEDNQELRLEEQQHSPFFRENFGSKIRNCDNLNTLKLEKKTVSSDLKHTFPSSNVNYSRKDEDEVEIIFSGEKFPGPIRPVVDKKSRNRKQNGRRKTSEQIVEAVIDICSSSDEEEFREIPTNFDDLLANFDKRNVTETQRVDKVEKQCDKEIVKCESVDNIVRVENPGSGNDDEFSDVPTNFDEFLQKTEAEQTGSNSSQFVSIEYKNDSNNPVGKSVQFLSQNYEESSENRTEKLEDRSIQRTGSNKSSSNHNSSQDKSINCIINDAQFNKNIPNVSNVGNQEKLTDVIIIIDDDDEEETNIPNTIQPDLMRKVENEQSTVNSASENNGTVAENSSNFEQELIEELPAETVQTETENTKEKGPRTIEQQIETQQKDGPVAEINSSSKSQEEKDECEIPMVSTENVETPENCLHCDETIIDEEEIVAKGVRLEDQYLEIEHDGVQSKEKSQIDEENEAELPVVQNQNLEVEEITIEREKELLEGEDECRITEEKELAEAQILENQSLDVEEAEAQPVENRQIAEEKEQKKTETVENGHLESEKIQGAPQAVQTEHSENLIAEKCVEDTDSERTEEETDLVIDESVETAATNEPEEAESNSSFDFINSSIQSNSHNDVGNLNRAIMMTGMPKSTPKSNKLAIPKSPIFNKTSSSSIQLVQPQKTIEPIPNYTATNLVGTGNFENTSMNYYNAHDLNTLATYAACAKRLPETVDKIEEKKHTEEEPICISIPETVDNNSTSFLDEINMTFPFVVTPKKVSKTKRRGRRKKLPNTPAGSLLTKKIISSDSDDDKPLQIRMGGRKNIKSKTRTRTRTRSSKKDELAALQISSTDIISTTPALMPTVAPEKEPEPIIHFKKAILANQRKAEQIRESSNSFHPQPVEEISFLSSNNKISKSKDKPKRRSKQERKSYETFIDKPLFSPEHILYSPKSRNVQIKAKSNIFEEPNYQLPTPQNKSKKRAYGRSKKVNINEVPTEIKSNDKNQKNSRAPIRSESKRKNQKAKIEIESKNVKLDEIVCKSEIKSKKKSRRSKKIVEAVEAISKLVECVQSEENHLELVEMEQNPEQIEQQAELPQIEVQPKSTDFDNMNEVDMEIDEESNVVRIETTPQRNDDETRTEMKSDAQNEEVETSTIVEAQTEEDQSEIQNDSTMEIQSEEIIVQELVTSEVLVEEQKKELHEDCQTEEIQQEFCAPPEEIEETKSDENEIENNDNENIESAAIVDEEVKENEPEDTKLIQIAPEEKDENEIENNDIENIESGAIVDEEVKENEPDDTKLSQIAPEGKDENEIELCFEGVTEPPKNEGDIEVDNTENLIQNQIEIEIQQEAVTAEIIDKSMDAEVASEAEVLNQVETDSEKIEINTEKAILNVEGKNLREIDSETVVENEREIQEEPTVLNEVETEQLPSLNGEENMEKEDASLTPSKGEDEALKKVETEVDPKETATSNEEIKMDNEATNTDLNEEIKKAEETTEIDSNETPTSYEEIKIDEETAEIEPTPNEEMDMDEEATEVDLNEELVSKEEIKIAEETTEIDSNETPTSYEETAEIEPTPNEGMDMDEEATEVDLNEKLASNEEIEIAEETTTGIDSNETPTSNEEIEMDEKSTEIEPTPNEEVEMDEKETEQIPTEEVEVLNEDEIKVVPNVEMPSNEETIIDEKETEQLPPLNEGENMHEEDTESTSSKVVENRVDSNEISSSNEEKSRELLLPNEEEAKSSSNEEQQNLLHENELKSEEAKVEAETPQVIENEEKSTCSNSTTQTLIENNIEYESVESLEEHTDTSSSPVKENCTEIVGDDDMDLEAENIAKTSTENNQAIDAISLSFNEMELKAKTNELIQTTPVPVRKDSRSKSSERKSKNRNKKSKLCKKVVLPPVRRKEIVVLQNILLNSSTKCENELKSKEDIITLIPTTSPPKNNILLTPEKHKIIRMVKRNRNSENTQPSGNCVKKVKTLGELKHFDEPASGSNNTNSLSFSIENMLKPDVKTENNPTTQPKCKLQKVIVEKIDPMGYSSETMLPKPIVPTLNVWNAPVVHPVVELVPFGWGIYDTIPPPLPPEPIPQPPPPPPPVPPQTTENQIEIVSIDESKPKKSRKSSRSKPRKRVKPKLEQKVQQLKRLVEQSLEQQKLQHRQESVKEEIQKNEAREIVHSSEKIHEEQNIETQTEPSVEEIKIESRERVENEEEMCQTEHANEKSEEEVLLENDEQQQEQFINPELDDQKIQAPNVRVEEEKQELFEVRQQIEVEQHQQEQLHEDNPQGGVQEGLVELVEHEYSLNNGIQVEQNQPINQVENEFEQLIQQQEKETEQQLYTQPNSYQSPKNSIPKLDIVSPTTILNEFLVGIESENSYSSPFVPHENHQVQQEVNAYNRNFHASTPAPTTNNTTFDASCLLDFDIISYISNLSTDAVATNEDFEETETDPMVGGTKVMSKHGIEDPMPSSNLSFDEEGVLKQIAALIENREEPMDQSSEEPLGISLAEIEVTTTTSKDATNIAANKQLDMEALIDNQEEPNDKLIKELGLCLAEIEISTSKGGPTNNINSAKLGEMRSRSSSESSTKSSYEKQQAKTSSPRVAKIPASKYAPPPRKLATSEVTPPKKTLDEQKTGCGQDKPPSTESNGAPVLVPENLETIPQNNNSRDMPMLSSPPSLPPRMKMPINCPPVRRAARNIDFTNFYDDDEDDVDERVRKKRKPRTKPTTTSTEERHQVPKKPKLDVGNTRNLDEEFDRLKNSVYVPPTKMTRSERILQNAFETTTPTPPISGDKQNVFRGDDGRRKKNHNHIHEHLEEDRRKSKHSRNYSSNGKVPVSSGGGQNRRNDKSWQSKSYRNQSVPTSSSLPRRSDQCSQPRYFMDACHNGQKKNDDTEKLYKKLDELFPLENNPFENTTTT